MYGSPKTSDRINNITGTGFSPSTFQTSSMTRTTYTYEMKYEEIEQVIPYESLKT
jgi:hypothetical protein